MERVCEKERMKRMVILQTHNLKKIYGKVEFTAIVGTSGSGGHVKIRLIL